MAMSCIPFLLLPKLCQAIIHIHYCIIARQSDEVLKRVPGNNGVVCHGEPVEPYRAGQPHTLRQAQDDPTLFVISFFQTPRILRLSITWCFHHNNSYDPLIQLNNCGRSSLTSLMRILIWKRPAVAMHLNTGGPSILSAA